MSPRVYLLTPQYPEPGEVSVGGLYTHTQELVAGLEALGCQPTVITSRLTKPSVVEGRVHRLQPSAAILQMPLGADGSPTAQQLQRFNEELAAYILALAERTGEKPDVLHCHDFWMVPAALQVQQRLGAKLLVSVHMLHLPLRRWWGSVALDAVGAVEKQFCHAATALIAVSASIRDVLHESLGVPLEKIAVVHNGFDTGLFQKPPAPETLTALREQWGLQGRVVAFAGRPTFQKGVVPLLRSALRVLKAQPDITYALAGMDMQYVHAQGQQGTSESQQIADEVAALEAQHPVLKSNVKRLGNLSREQLAALYHLSELTVVPSLYEPFGYAVVEPMAAGSPVVAVASGGPAEILQDEGSGLLVPVHRDADGRLRLDDSELAWAQLRVLWEPGLANTLRESGRRVAEARFDRATMARATLAVYARLSQS
ncbi:glycosyltransferase family 4 protein [Corallococcus llansteffanensis]|uniref:Glycosyltransferase family 1 protein n=1 Tax=Corallococcus llansteffanensis TaxID=2316731 RepID=A0A3A8Q5M0_9BACT|nr:glycosyltransferase family 4 protein [Corallococcus llansteffanensis]RKH58574.1 glycosyltransferase family 1 protein [Corallococcus llansteffanensis]